MADVRVVVDRLQLAELVVSPSGDVAADLTRRALKVNNQAKRLCPVDTGRLRSSIAFRVERSGESLAAIIGTNVEYAAYVELGTRRMNAQPYLRPALDAAR